MKERESNKKHMFRRIACLFVALMVMGILGNGYVAPAEAKQKKQKAEETEYKVMEEEDLLYLVDEEGEYQSGWFFKLGGRYIPFKKVKNLGLYKPNKIRILYADSEGMLAQDEEKGDFSFDEKGFLSDATGLCQIKKKYYLFKNGKICPSHLQKGQILYAFRWFCVCVQRKEQNLYSVWEEDEFPAGERCGVQDICQYDSAKNYQKKYDTAGGTAKMFSVYCPSL